MGTMVVVVMMGTVVVVLVVGTVVVVLGTEMMMVVGDIGGGDGGGYNGVGREKSIGGGEDSGGEDSVGGSGDTGGGGGVAVRLGKVSGGFVWGCSSGCTAFGRGCTCTPWHLHKSATGTLFS